MNMRQAGCPRRGGLAIVMAGLALLMLLSANTMLCPASTAWAADGLLAVGAAALSAGDSEAGALNDQALQTLAATGLKIRQVAVGEGHVAAILSDGSLWMWGLNSYGQLGDGTTKNRSNPVKVLTSVKGVSLGWVHSAAVKTDGSLWMWGDNSEGQLGDGTTVERHKPVKVLSSVKSVSLGFFHSGAVKSDGSLWMWGANYCGEIGDGSVENRRSPVKVMASVSALSLGFEYTAAIKTDGGLWAWGYIDGGAQSTRIVSPKKLLSSVSSVSLGKESAAAVKTDGSLWMWGKNDYGQLGNGTRTSRTSPAKVLSSVKSVSLGDSHSGAIKNDGSLWMWGCNENGQIGDGTRADRLSPVRVLSSVSSVSLGGAQSAALRSDGSLQMWGDNQDGQLGLGNQSSHVKPVFVNFPISSASLGLSKVRYSYTGKAIKPSVTVKFAGQVLKKGVDYTVAYKKNKKMGTAKIVVKGKGNFRGKKTRTFKIVPKGCPIEWVESAFDEDHYGFTVRWTKSTKGVTGYQVRASLNESFKSAKSKYYMLSTQQAKARKATIFVPSSWAGKWVYVQVRTYAKANGKTYRSAWSETHMTQLTRPYGTVPKGCPVTAFEVGGKNYVSALNKVTLGFYHVDYNIHFKKGSRVLISTKKNWKVVKIEVNHLADDGEMTIYTIRNGSSLSKDSYYISATLKNTKTGARKYVTLSNYA